MKGEIAKLEDEVSKFKENISNRTKSNDKLHTELSSKTKTINKLEEQNKKLNKVIKSQSERGLFDRIKNKSTKIE